MKKKYTVQVDSDLYSQERYLTTPRWSSYSLIVREVIKLYPQKILEIGPGNGIITNILRNFGFKVLTLDFDPNVKPDILTDITKIEIEKLKNSNFDLIIAAEIFEHISFENFVSSIKKLKNVAPKLLLTLPYTTKNSVFFSFSFNLPIIKRVSFSKKLIFRKEKHEFNGQHYWEIGKISYPLHKISSDINKSGWEIYKQFINPENPYHYFFLLSQKHD